MTAFKDRHRAEWASSAAEFNAELPEVAHEAATARAIQRACGITREQSADHPLQPYDAKTAIEQQDLRAAFDASAPTPEQLEAAGLIRRSAFTWRSRAGYPSKPVCRRERCWVPTAAGSALCARVKRYIAAGGQLPVLPLAEILRAVTGLQAPAVAMPPPHPFVVSRYAEPRDVVRHAAVAAEQHEKELLARLGFNARNNSTRRLNSMTARLLRRDVREAGLCGLVRRKGDLLITTDLGARAAAKIPAPAKARAA